MHTTSYAYGCAPSPTGSATHVHVELLREAPAPVVAGMLGYHPVTPQALAAEVGATWKRYAPGGQVW